MQVICLNSILSIYNYIIYCLVAVVGKHFGIAQLLGWNGAKVSILAYETAPSKRWQSFFLSLSHEQTMGLDWIKMIFILKQRVQAVNRCAILNQK